MWTNADDLAPYMQKNPQFWYPVLQAMIGKLYVLSLYYMMYGIFLPWSQQDPF
jgi:hypothetical protein